MEANLRYTSSSVNLLPSTKEILCNVYMILIKVCFYLHLLVNVSILYNPARTKRNESQLFLDSALTFSADLATQHGRGKCERTGSPETDQPISDPQSNTQA